MKSGNKNIARYSRDDLELFTRSNGGNAYHSAEEWMTDEAESERANKKVKKLVCIDKW